MRSTFAITIAAILLYSSGSVIAQPADEIAELRKQVAALRGMVATLETKIDTLEKKQAVAAVPTPPPPGPVPQAPPARVISGLAQAETSRRDAETAARINNVPIDPSRKGYIAIPGTRSSFKIGGYAKLDAIYDPSPAGDKDQFTTSTIPVGVPPGANTANFNLMARQTRFNVDFRRPTTHGDFRMFLEADFFGGDGPTAFRIRHAYGQMKNVLLGWTWSTLADPDALPDTLDFQMTNGVSVTRQPQVRFTAPLGTHSSLAFGLEKPNSDLSIDGVSNVTRYPDGVIRFRHERERGHLQVGTVFRQISGASSTLNANRSVFGVGGLLAGGFKLDASDNILFGASYGDGMAHYISNLSGLGLDAAPNTARDDLKALPSLGAYGAYRRQWAKTVRSSFTYGLNRISNTDAQPDTAFRQAYYLSGNLIWRPFLAAEMGFEYLRGKNVLRNRESANANRFQFSIKYDLIY